MSSQEMRDHPNIPHAGAITEMGNFEILLARTSSDYTREDNFDGVDKGLAFITALIGLFEEHDACIGYNLNQTTMDYDLVNKLMSKQTMDIWLDESSLLIEVNGFGLTLPTLREAHNKLLMGVKK
jgi:hypothetical protein